MPDREQDLGARQSVGFRADPWAIQFTWPTSPMLAAIQAPETTARTTTGASKARRRRASSLGRTAKTQMSMEAGASSANNWVAVASMRQNTESPQPPSSRVVDPFEQGDGTQRHQQCAELIWSGVESLQNEKRAGSRQHGGDDAAPSSRDAQAKPTSRHDGPEEGKKRERAHPCDAPRQHQPEVNQHVVRQHDQIYVL